MRSNAKDLLKNVEQRVEKQSLDVSISSINEKNSKTLNKLREVSKFIDNLYNATENLRNRFEEFKNTKEYVQEVDERTTAMRQEFSKEIEVG